MAIVFAFEEFYHHSFFYEACHWGMFWTCNIVIVYTAIRYAACLRHWTREVDDAEPIPSRRVNPWMTSEMSISSGAHSAGQAHDEVEGEDYLDGSGENNHSSDEGDALLVASGFRKRSNSISIGALARNHIPSTEELAQRLTEDRHESGTSRRPRSSTISVGALAAFHLPVTERDAAIEAEKALGRVPLERAIAAEERSRNGQQAVKAVQEELESCRCSLAEAETRVEEALERENALQQDVADAKENLTAQAQTRTAQVVDVKAASAEVQRLSAVLQAMPGAQAENLPAVLESLRSICGDLARALPPAEEMPTTAVTPERNAEPETLDADVEMDEEDAAELEAMLGELGSAPAGGAGAGAGGDFVADRSSAGSSP
jgi:hypothetical protein